MNRTQEDHDQLHARLLAELEHAPEGMASIGLARQIWDRADSARDVGWRLFDVFSALELLRRQGRVRQVGALWHLGAR